jgi:hypothetical protein
MKESLMPNTTPRQRKTTGRVMHEFKHGELKSGPAGKGGKVKSHRQAVAIALKEAGATKYESNKANRKNLAQSKRKEARRYLPAGKGRKVPRGCPRAAGKQPRDGRQERNRDDRRGA